MLTFEDLTTFVGTLSLLKAENDAASGRANTNKLTMLIIFLYLQLMILLLPVIEDACTIGGMYTFRRRSCRPHIFLFSDLHPSRGSTKKRRSPLFCTLKIQQLLFHFYLRIVIAIQQYSWSSVWIRELFLRDLCHCKKIG